MRDYWLTQQLLSIVGWGYLVGVAVLLLIIGLIPSPKQVKKVGLLVALGLSLIWPFQAYQEYRQEKAALEDFQARQAEARALFEERCKTAGRKVSRVVNGVDGIRLLSTREPEKPGSVSDAMWSGAALPHDSSGENFVGKFLMWEHKADGQVGRGYLNTDPKGAVVAAYSFVDVRQADGSFLRYRRDAQTAEMTFSRVDQDLARYAFDFTPAGLPTDRALWVAGIKMRVLDTTDGKVLAEETVFSFEPGLGSRAGGRQPWAFAVSCPEWRGWLGARARFFVDEVLRPN